jgi:8-oxo-dGTP pyrophosphatase MutT (NUDIX family)
MFLFRPKKNNSRSWLGKGTKMWKKSKVVEENGQRIIKHEDNPGSIGVTYELCAGIVDKDTSLEQIAQAEVLEECGYKVPLDKLERFCSCRSVHIFLLR